MNAAAEYAIEIENLTKVYDMGEEKVHALRGVSAKFRTGEFWAVMGSSGSGKSTMLQILGCLDRPTSGSYRLNGREVSRLGLADLVFRSHMKLYHLELKRASLEEMFMSTALSFEAAAQTQAPAAPPAQQPGYAQQAVAQYPQQGQGVGNGI